MSRFRLTRGLIAAMVFVVLVAVSGFALAKAGYMENPFRVVSQLTGGGEDFRSGEGEGDRANFQPPDRSTQNGGSTDGSTQQFSERGRGENSTSLNWNDLGSVLYNLWFIAACAAFVMIVGRPVGYLFRLLRQRWSHTRVRPVTVPPISEAA